MTSWPTTRHVVTGEHMFRHLLVAAASVWLGAPAFAQSVVDQVERLDTEVNETEFELQSILAERTANEDELQLHIFSAEHGVSDWLSFGFELQVEAEEGEDLSADVLLAQMKLLFLGHEDSPFKLGAQASAGPSLAGGGGEVEIEFLAEGRWLGLDLAADLMIETSFDESETEFGYALRSDWRREWGAIAIEAGGDISEPGDEERRHWLGPVVELSLTQSFAIEISYLRGLTSATPDQQLRLQLMLRR
jgi:hypothetical protein